ncbi:hypothetical protein KY362_06395, partial [Candidatus Woesearchaeota archaeon]|nr:hypothetical protein [Candidatus Woesearchaeota archaeon]
AMNNKFTDYCRRIMNTIGHERQDRQTIIYTLLADLERIADEYKRICDFFHAERKPASKEVLAIFKEINKYARTYYELFYKYDPVKLKYMTDGGKDIVPRLESFVQSSNRHDAMLAHHLIYITIGLYDLSYTYIELNM